MYRQTERERERERERDQEKWEGEREVFMARQTENCPELKKIFHIFFGYCRV
jgi:hypothetical protein